MFLPPMYFQKMNDMKDQKPRLKILYDAQCGFCRSSVKLLRSMDWWGRLDFADGPKLMNELRLIAPDGKTYGGFFAFRQLVWKLPLLYLMIPLVYFPGSGLIGPKVYHWVANNRHFLSTIHSPKDCQL